MNRLWYFWIALLLLFHAACEAEETPPLAAAPFDSAALLGESGEQVQRNVGLIADHGVCPLVGSE